MRSELTAITYVTTQAGSSPGTEVRGGACAVRLPSAFPAQSSGSHFRRGQRDQSNVAHMVDTIRKDCDGAHTAV